jgi:hypothetical protein
MLEAGGIFDPLQPESPRQIHSFGIERLGRYCLQKSCQPQQASAGAAMLVFSSFA